MESYKIIAMFSLLFSFIPTFNTLETVSSGQSMKAKETLISPNGVYEAGFFNFEGSNSQYFGIWYKNISPRAYVWVANRDTPIINSTAILEVTNGGNLTILDGTGAIVWSSNASKIVDEKPVFQLLDSGNLVVMDESNPNNFLWQSFENPTDTLLPGQKIHANLITGQYTGLTSWTSAENPTSGQYSMHLDPHGLPQCAITTRDSKLLYRAGPWNGILFTGVPWDRNPKFFNYSFMLSKEEAYYKYDLYNSSTITRYLINPSGVAQRFTWSDEKLRWDLFSSGPTYQCDSYGICGANSECKVDNSPICDCLKGFIPKNAEKWASSDWTYGCVRRTNLSCNSSDGFFEYTGMQMPDTSSSWFNENMTLEECRKFCLENCSCTAYTSLDVRNGGSGCLLWFNAIIDMSQHLYRGQDLYIRLAASELDQIAKNRKSDKKKVAGISAGLGAFTIATTIVGLAIYLWRRKPRKPEKEKIIKQKDEIDLPEFEFSIIANATNDFFFNNKLGEGGFGPVYKGALVNGQEIAVKRLAQRSGQGPEEFKNEVMLISKLQHRNLVKLLGCSIQDDERLLVYEFMANRSLDCFIFDQTRRKLLDWSKRFQIISGIARGILYLHQDSRLKIIHRDLKTSNILLDDDMNPKISDFGMARTFGGDSSEGNTQRVMGTHGYLSPEYITYGSYSVKSDIFSYGVIVLEIVSGMRIREFHDPYHHLNLLGHAWRLWTEERPLELIDESLGDSVILNQVLRCIQIGLLCVQERPEDRPDMSYVVLMLNGEKTLPKPRKPGFYPPENQGFSSGQLGRFSLCECSITLLDAR